MEDNDDEEHFEAFIYGQSEPNQYALNRLRLAIRKNENVDAKYMPVQDDTKLKDGDAD